MLVKCIFSIIIFFIFIVLIATSFTDTVVARSFRASLRDIDDIVITNPQRDACTCYNATIILFFLIFFFILAFIVIHDRVCTSSVLTLLNSRHTLFRLPSCSSSTHPTARTVSSQLR